MTPRSSTLTLTKCSKLRGKYILSGKGGNCMTQGIAAEEKTFKKGEVIYQQGDYVAAIYDVLRGQVALYVDYRQPTQRLLTEAEDAGFFGVVGFLDSRPQNASAVAREKTVCSVITHENFGHYFQERPAKIMSIMQYMSKRMRILTRGYLEASQALEEYADAERLLRERKDWYEEHQDLYHRIMGLFGF